MSRGVPNRWTEADKAFVLENAERMTDAEISAQLGRSTQLVSQLRRELCGLKRRPWTPEEEQWLMENWGVATYDGICRKLGRSKAAIQVRVQRLGLAPYYESGNYITVNQLFRALGQSESGGSYKAISWIKNRGMPVKSKKRGNFTASVIRMEDFWAWAEKNRSFIDFSKMEPLALGAEPPWVPEQRRKDYLTRQKVQLDPWTGAEDSRLAFLLAQHRYGYAELSKMFCRSEGAIERRIKDLGLPDRPVKAERADWTPEDFSILADGIRNGDSYTAIAEQLGRSETAVRGHVYYEYLTERADRVRAMMGDHEWGYGAPTPTVKQGLCLSRTRTETRKQLSRLDAVLRKRLNDLGYEPYFQRLMCENWDDIGGCGAGCGSCDECTEFRRIREQYCARCGATFLERRENRFCPACRTARKKQAQRSYMRRAAATK